MEIGWGCCVGDRDRFQVNSRTWQPGRIVTREGQTSIAAAYNSILSELEPLGLDAVILVHDDLEVTDPNAVEKVLAEFVTADVALVGVAGGGSGGGTTLAWWDYDPIGHQQTDEVMIDFGQRRGEVTLLEGSFLAFSPWASRTLRFDETLSGFHGYDEIAMQARDLGGRCVVADIDTHHHTLLGFKSPKSADEWWRGVNHFRRKWEC